MKNQASRRTFVGTVLATLAALVARPVHTLAQISGKEHRPARDARTVFSSEAAADVTTYAYDRSARLISITHAAK